MFHCSLDYDVMFFSSLITKDVSYLLYLVFTLLIAEAMSSSLPRKREPSLLLCFVLVRLQEKYWIPCLLCGLHTGKAIRCMEKLFCISRELGPSPLAADNSTRLEVCPDLALLLCCMYSTVLYIMAEVG